MDFLTKREAQEFLGLEDAHFKNFLDADEFPLLPRKSGGRYAFDKIKLEKWKEEYPARMVSLNINDYARCLDFALAQHARNYVMVDWGTARQREFGQKVANWMRGQLGELGVAMFCKKNLGIDIELDFEIHDEIVPQDVISITVNGKKYQPKKKIAIKTTKMRNAYLVLGLNEVDRPERRSDVYILTRVNMPDDHLLRIATNDITKIVSSQQHFNSYKDKLPKFEPIMCEIAGFVYVNELEKISGIPSIDGERYAKKSGQLRRSIDDWKKAFSV